jgi:HD-GYP domain-containing protein (c-di-GMP phosphodiesterase class II)
MSDTQVLLKKIAALRHRLEQAQGLAKDVDAAAVPAPAETWPGPLRVHRLERDLADASQHQVLLDSSLRQLSATEMTQGEQIIFPTQLTARASRLLKWGQELLAQLRTLANHPLIQTDDHDPLSLRYRETVAMTDTVLRTVQAFPNAPSAQLRMCDGLGVILGLVAERLAGLHLLVEERGHQAGWLETLADLLAGLADGRLLNIKPYVLLAESILTQAQLGAPLRFFTSAATQPAHFVAAHSLNVAQVIARLARHDNEFRSRALDTVLAALLHDVGMLRVPRDILAHAGPLNDEQRRAIELHAMAGAELVLRVLPTAAWLTEATVGHHERLDGMGYPSGLRDVQISSQARLLAVCDVYAALCAPRPHRAALETRTALTDTLLLAEQNKLDRFHAERLLQLSFYPVGTVVELADGAVGVIVATHQHCQDLNSPARPVLILLTDSRRRTLPVPRPLDLAACEGRSIVRSLPQAEARALLGRRFPEWV